MCSINTHLLMSIQMKFINNLSFSTFLNGTYILPGEFQKYYHHEIKNQIGTIIAYITICGILGIYNFTFFTNPRLE